MRKVVSQWRRGRNRELRRLWAVRVHSSPYFVGSLVRQRVYCEEEANCHYGGRSHWICSTYVRVAMAFKLRSCFRRACRVHPFRILPHSLLHQWSHARGGATADARPVGVWEGQRGFERACSEFYQQKGVGAPMRRSSFCFMLVRKVNGFEWTRIKGIIDYHSKRCPT